MLNRIDVRGTLEDLAGALCLVFCLGAALLIGVGMGL